MTDDTRKAPARTRTPRKRAKSKAQTAAARAPTPEAEHSDARANTPERSAPPSGTPDTRAPSPAPPRRLAVIPMHVRWRDLDAFNHVNNSAYLTYLEEARLEWLRDVPGDWFDQHAMPVMAAVELHYRKPITWPADIDVRLTCERLGRSSVTIGHHVVDHNDPDCIHATGNVVVVWVDPTTGQSVPLPEAIRTACRV